jgi:hypothetical protein
LVVVTAQVPTVLGGPAVHSELAQQPVGALATHFVLVAVHRRALPVQAATQEVPLQDAVPPVGTGQPVHLVPQLLTLVFDEQTPLQSCVVDVHG